LHACLMLLFVPPIIALSPRAPVPIMTASDAPPAVSGPPRKAGWLPGAFAPTYLDGTLAGDVGFDPLGYVALARTKASTDSVSWSGVERSTRLLMATRYEQQRKVYWMREAEVKHGRIAMVAAAGWPISELLDKPLSNALGLPYALEATSGRAPSLFNGHLLDGPQGWFLLLVALATAALELTTLDNVAGLTPTGYVPGDLGFDPLSLRDSRPDMDLAEIKHGRLAMLGVTGFAVQEALYGVPVVDQTPAFFHPPF